MVLGALGSGLGLVTNLSAVRAIAQLSTIAYNPSPFKTRCLAFDTLACGHRSPRWELENVRGIAPKDSED